MTQREIDLEWCVEYETALGEMCGKGDSTERQRHAAKIRADEHVEALRRQETDVD